MATDLWVGVDVPQRAPSMSLLRMYNGWSEGNVSCTTFTSQYGCCGATLGNRIDIGVTNQRSSSRLWAYLFCLEPFCGPVLSLRVCKASWDLLHNTEP